MPYVLDTQKTWTQTEKELKVEFQRWARLRGGTVKYGVFNMRGHREVTLKYTLPGADEMTLIMGEQARAEDNLRVLFLCIEALRLNELRGIAPLMQKAYMALPAPEAEVDPYELLGISPNAPANVIDAAYRALAKDAHPDHGGSAAKMAELNKAYERAKKA